MCIFSGNVGSVSKTKIFSCQHDGLNYLVYSMTIEDHDDVAMILPVPCYQSERAFEFINLEKYPYFFDDLENCFPRPKGRGLVFGPLCLSLEVVEVGDFVASFVPTIDDFEKLDPQFRLPSLVFDKIPDYKNYSFAVFQLKKGVITTKQPMAFSYQPKNSNQLFFPTVHMHDGKISEFDEFDHVLYMQENEKLKVHHSWSEGTSPQKVMDLEKVPFISPDFNTGKIVIQGKALNRDIVVESQITSSLRYINYSEFTPQGHKLPKGVKIYLYRLGDLDKEHLYLYSTSTERHFVRLALEHFDHGGISNEDFEQLMDFGEVTEVTSLDQVPEEDQECIPFETGEYINAWDKPLYEFDLTIKEFFEELENKEDSK